MQENMPSRLFNDTDIETKKLLDELVAWDEEEFCFTTSVERQLEIISKLDDKQKAYLKNFLTKDGEYYILNFDLKIIKQFMINKIFTYDIFNIANEEPDRQLFILENLDCDKDAKQALLKAYEDKYWLFAGCHKSVLKKLEEVTGIEVDQKTSYEYLASLYDENTYTQNNKELYNSGVYTTTDGNCVFHSRLQALENKKLDYNDELNQKIIELRKEVAEDYKHAKHYWIGVFDQKVYDGLKNNYSYCDSRIVGAYFAKKYKKTFLDFGFSGGNADKTPTLYCDGGNIKSHRNAFFDFINGCPSTVCNEIHCQTILMDKTQRKQFFSKFIRLKFYYAVCNCLFDDNKELIPNLFRTETILGNSVGLNLLFCINYDEREKFKSQLKSYFDLIPQKFKARKTFELSKFLIEEFIELVIKPENINITAEEFFSRVLEDFKIENLDKDQDIKLELEAAKKREDKKNMEEQNKNNAAETKKFIDELLAWNYKKIGFKFSVQECLDIIPKLDETQRQQLKEYFSTYIGGVKLRKLGFDVMKQLIKYKAFPYKRFYEFKDKPDFQLFMLENINNDQNLKDELIFDGCFINICMCNESVLNNFKQITGVNVDLKMSYENITKDWNENTHAKKYHDLYNNYTTNVKADGNCVFYSLIQANENIIILDYNSELEQKVASLREEAADDYKQSSGSLFVQWVFDELRTNYVDCKPQFVVPYFSKKYQKNFFYFSLGGYDQDSELPGIYFVKPSGKAENSIKNMLINFLNGAPAITSDYRHCKTINTDRNKRKEFVIKFLKLKFYSEMRYSLINRNDDIKIFDFNISSYWLDLLFGLDENQKQKFEEQLVSYFVKIPPTYKSRKILELKKFLIEKFIELVIKPENIKMTAEEFFSKVLEDFRTENLAKEQDFSIGLREKFANPNQEIKKEDKEINMKIDFDAIFKKFDLEIGKHISFKDQKFDYLESVNNDLFNNYTDDVPPDGNCTFWALTQALENKKLDEKKDYDKIVKLREEVAEWCKKEYGWDDNNETVITIRTPGKYLNDGTNEHLRKYLSYKYNTAIFDFSCYGVGSEFDYNDNRNKADLVFFNLKDSFFSVINGACCVVGGEKHSRVLKLDPELRKKFYLKFFDPYMIHHIVSDLKDHVERNKGLDKLLKRCTIFLNKLFFNEPGKDFVLKDQIEKLIKFVPDELKIKILCELAVFTYKKFKTRVLEEENKNITAEEFYSGVFKEFKEKYIDNDPDLDQNKENQNQTQIQTEKTNTEQEEINTNNDEHQKIDPKSEKINQDTSLKKEIINDDEINKIDLNLVRNSMLFVAVLLGDNKLFEAILKMNDSELKDLFEKNKNEIGDAIKKIRDDSKIKDFLKQNTDVKDIIELNNSKIKLLDDKLNEKYFKTWVASLSGGGVVCISLGVAAICTFFSGLVIFPGLAIASGAVGLPTLALTCYKFIDNKTRQKIKSGPLSRLDSNKINDLMKKINIGRVK